MKKKVNVVCSIIQNDKGEVLCALRSNNMPMSKLWELPAGKIQENESIANSIIREIHKKLNCTVEFLSVFNNNNYEYENTTVNIITVKCKLTNSLPDDKEHAKLIWIPIEYLNSLTWVPACIPTINKLIAENKKHTTVA